MTEWFKKQIQRFKLISTLIPTKLCKGTRLVPKISLILFNHIRTINCVWNVGWPFKTEKTKLLTPFRSGTFWCVKSRDEKIGEVDTRHNTKGCSRRWISPNILRQNGLLRGPIRSVGTFLKTLSGSQVLLSFKVTSLYLWGFLRSVCVCFRLDAIRFLIKFLIRTCETSLFCWS